MGLLALFVAYVVLPVAVGALPLLLRERRVAQFVPVVPRLPSSPGYQATSRGRAAPDEAWPRVRCLLEGAVLVSCVLVSLANVVEPSAIGQKFFTQARNAAVLGLLSGGATIGVLALVRATLSLKRSADLLEHLGVAGVWHPEAQLNRGKRIASDVLGRMEEILDRIPMSWVPTRPADSGPQTLAAEIQRTVGSCQRLDAVSLDGGDVFTFLALDPANPAGGPNPALCGARIRILLLPPRSNRVDPEKKRLSTAEVALARAGRSPEEHWRHLRNIFALQKDWASRGVAMEVRFLENRPAFTCLVAGERVWCHHWPNLAGYWLDLDGSSEEGLGQAMRDYFACEWANASSELSIPLGDGATGSTVIRKGVEVAGESEARARA